MLDSSMPKAQLIDNVFNILLLQVVPGQENLVVDQLRNVFQDSAIYYLGLGRYDLIVIQKESELSLLKEYQVKGFNGVTDWFPICGVQWSTKKDVPSLSGMKRFLGISVVKLNPKSNACRKHGPIKIELDLVERLSERIDNPVCCNLSNYELVCLIETDSLEQLSAEVIKIKNILTQEENALALDITTIPAVEMRWLKYIPERFDEKTEISIFLSLRIGITDKLVNDIEDGTIFGGLPVQPKSIYGFHDAILMVSGPLIDIIRGILKLRDKHKDYGLYSTFAIISHFDKPVQLRSEEESEEKFLGLSFKFEPLGEAVYHFSQLFNTSRHDFLSANLFRQHGELWKAGIELVDEANTQHKDKNMKQYRNWLSKYDSLTNCLRQCFSQRFSGLAPGNLLAHKSLGLEPHGSIQRAILALESIPLFVFTELSVQWQGFCSYGYEHRFYRTEGGVINTPSEYRVRPEMWWGVFHELGHEAFVEMLPEKIVSWADQVVEAMAEQSYNQNISYGIELSKETYTYDYTDLCGEIFAELFGFYYGFNCDWDLYLEKVWRYFANEFPIDFRYLSRSILAKLTLGPGTNLRRLEITSDYLSECIEEIEDIVENEFGVTIHTSEKEMAKRVVGSFLNIADKFAEYLSGRPQLAQCDAVQVDKIKRDLSNGIPFLTSNPLEVIFSLMRYRDRITTPMRVASILSLYNAYWRTLCRLDKVAT